MHIGRMEVRLWDGSYIIEDLRIDGLTPTVRAVPRRQAHHGVERRGARCSTAGSSSNNIEMTDWRMHVESTAGREAQLPAVHPRPSARAEAGGRRRCTYVRAHRGEFTYQDFGTPWGIVARNLDVVVEKPTADANYRGTANFTDGLVAIQSYVPFRTDMKSRFVIDGGRVVFDRIDLTTDGTRSELKGDVNMRYWPEQMLHDEVDDRLPEGARAVLRQRQVRAHRHGRVQRHVPPVQGADAERAARGPAAS